MSSLKSLVLEDFGSRVLELFDPLSEGLLPFDEGTQIDKIIDAVPYDTVGSIHDLMIDISQQRGHYHARTVFYWQQDW